MWLWYLPRLIKLETVTAETQKRTSSVEVATVLFYQDQTMSDFPSRDAGNWSSDIFRRINSPSTNDRLRIVSTLLRDADP